MCKKFYISQLIIACLVFVSTEIPAATFEVAPNIYYFNYEEFSTSGISLDREAGFLPGIKFRLSQLYNGNRYILYTSLHGGTVDYTGGTQTGQPHTTRTNQQLLQLGFEFNSKKFETVPGQLTIGIRHWEWQRDILDNNNVRGLYEIYRWSEISIGLNFETKKQNNAFYWAKVSALYIYKPDIEIFLESTTQTLNMAEKPGFRLNAGKTWAINASSSYSLSIITEYWEFGRSNTVFTDDFFGSSVFITEPDSKSLHTGLELSYIYNF